MPSSDPKDRMARSRKARAEAGGKQIAVMLTPLAADKLSRWLLRGLNVTQVVNKLLERSKP